MRSFVPAFDLRRAADLTEVLDLLAREPGRWRPFAGGTDLMVLLEAGRLEHREYISLWGLPGLRGIQETADTVTIGPMTTYMDVLRHETIGREFPMLRAAAPDTGGVATQNRGTLGGNLANASPAADTPPVLLAYDAQLELVSVRGVRRIACEAFHTGYKRLDLAPDELIRAIHLPRPPRPVRHLYRKVGTRRAQAISKVCFAGVLSADGGTVEEVRVALGSVAPTVIRARRAEAAIRGRRLDSGTIAAARQALAEDIAPIDDIRSTAAYRAEVAGHLLEAFLSEAL